VSLAWSTVAFLVLLLPGFCFLAARYFPEGFTRETATKNPLAQLAGIVLVSLLVHGLFYLALGDCSRTPHCIRLHYVFTVLQLSGADAASLREVALNIEQNRFRIFGYTMLASLGGAILGVVWGTGVVKNWKGFRRATQHQWVYRIRRQANQITFAYVLTDIQQDNRRLLYRGLLSDFALKDDGNFSYVVLEQPVRYYLVLTELKPVTSTDLPAIGATNPLAGVSGPKSNSFLLIEGGNIKNLVLDTYLLEVTEDSLEAVDAALRRTGPIAPEVASDPEMVETDGRTENPPSGVNPWEYWQARQLSRSLRRAKLLSKRLPPDAAREFLIETRALLERGVMTETRLEDLYAIVDEVAVRWSVWD